MADLESQAINTLDINISNRKKKVLIWISFLIYSIALYLLKQPKIPGQSYQAGNQIGQIIGEAFVYFTIGYMCFWLFTFKVKDKSSSKFLILGSLGFIIGLFIMFRLIH